MASKKQERTVYNVSPADFVVAWESSETVSEVSDRLGMPKPIVLARASGYRKDGVRLKKLRRESKKALDIDELNRLVEETQARVRAAKAAAAAGGETAQKQGKGSRISQDANAEAIRRLKGQ